MNPQLRVNNMKPLIDKVTVTGADDSVEIADLLEIQKAYPYVEWGILLSKSNEGAARFPSLSWISGLEGTTLNLSGHLCGRWVRDICAGNNTLFVDRPQFKGLFTRYQLNFHAYSHKIEDVVAFQTAIKCLEAQQIILRFDNVNNDLLSELHGANIDAVPLFDTSGGTGILPRHWPKAIDVYCGYAGGLSPSNLDVQMLEIAQVCGNKPIWVDAETRLRSSNDLQFDLDLVRAFLEAAKPWLIKS